MNETLAQERDHHFFVMLGQCCDSARVAGIEVGFELADGRVITGVPQESAISDEDDDAIDDTGTRTELFVDDVLVRMADVRSYRVVRPG